LVWSPKDVANPAEAAVATITASVPQTPPEREPDTDATEGLPETRDRRPKDREG
jgi:hypothetical protein